MATSAIIHCSFDFVIADDAGQVNDSQTAIAREGQSSNISIGNAGDIARMDPFCMSKETEQNHHATAMSTSILKLYGEPRGTRSRLLENFRSHP